MKTAFISVSDKAGLIPLVESLLYHKIELIASQGTRQFLQILGYPVQDINDYLQIKTGLDGRVKTLHSGLFMGILADRSKVTHLNELSALNLDLIDLVVVNLYPFAKKQEVNEIDIGGPALIRAAAKNYLYTTVLCDPETYGGFIQELAQGQGETSLDFRQEMAALAFAKTSLYDGLIADWLAKTNEADFSSLNLKKTVDLAYGENPQQKAGFYNQGDDLPNIKKIQGKDLSYNNLLDLDVGLDLVGEFEGIAASVIKHANPCGLALGSNPLEAVDKALKADLKSCFGGILVVNTKLDEDVALLLEAHFLEVLAAPSYSLEALNILAKKPRLRVIEVTQEKKMSKELRTVLNGFLIQEKDRSCLDLSQLEVPTQLKPEPWVYEVLPLAFSVLRYLKSNAIAIVEKGRTLGLSSGQTNRVDAVSQALDKVRGLDLSHALLASDGFFPFKDSMDLIAKSSIKTIMQPGGSIRDTEVISACDSLGLSLIMTGVRNFKH